jgi:hypothetical protein
MTDTTKHPIQPLSLDEHNVVRFKKNAIVDFLLEYSSARGCSLNELAAMPFSKEDRQQLAQLIGYSLSGYGELHYVDDSSYNAAELMYRKEVTETEARLEESEARLKETEAKLNKIKAKLKKIKKLINEGM